MVVVLKLCGGRGVYERLELTEFHDPRPRHRLPSTAVSAEKRSTSKEAKNAKISTPRQLAWQLTTRGPPFNGRLDVGGLVWDRSAAKAAEWSASLASERAMLSQIDAYVGGDGGWASGEVDPDEDDYPSSGGSNGEDFGADDY